MYKSMTSHIWVAQAQQPNRLGKIFTFFHASLSNSIQIQQNLKLQSLPSVQPLFNCRSYSLQYTVPVQASWLYSTFPPLALRCTYSCLMNHSLLGLLLCGSFSYLRKHPNLRCCILERRTIWNSLSTSNSKVVAIVKIFSSKSEPSAIVPSAHCYSLPL